jgi:hypothetical protein
LARVKNPNGVVDTGVCSATRKNPQAKTVLMVCSLPFPTASPPHLPLCPLEYMLTRNTYNLKSAEGVSAEGTSTSQQCQSSDPKNCICLSKTNNHGRLRLEMILSLVTYSRLTNQLLRVSSNSKRPDSRPIMSQYPSIPHIISVVPRKNKFALRHSLLNFRISKPNKSYSSKCLSNEVWIHVQ